MSAESSSPPTRLPSCCYSHSTHLFWITKLVVLQSNPSVLWPFTVFLVTARTELLLRLYLLEVHCCDYLVHLLELKIDSWWPSARAPQVTCLFITYSCRWSSQSSLTERGWTLNTLVKGNWQPWHSWGPPSKLSVAQHFRFVAFYWLTE